VEVNFWKWNGIKNYYIYTHIHTHTHNQMLLFSLFLFIVYSQKCPDIVYRKEVRHMKRDGDFDKFVDAYLQITLNGELEKLVRIHGEIWNHAHFNPKFLPWHRLYIKNLEVVLQRHGAKYLPYWDWSIDYLDPLHSPILSRDFFGSNDEISHKIKDSRFSHTNYKTAFGKYDLIRDYTLNDDITFYHPFLLDRERNNRSFSEWSLNLEYGPHALVHSVIGGKLGDMSKWTASNDPLFWLHHTFIDKLWWDYQTGNDKLDYDGLAYNSNVSKQDLLLPWNVQIQNVMNISDICVDYKIQQDIQQQDIQQRGGNITVPEPSVVTDFWLNNSNVNKTLAENIRNKTLQDVQDINSGIGSGIGTDGISKSGSLKLCIYSLVFGVLFF
jgi:hypothetical protein